MINLRSVGIITSVPPDKVGVAAAIFSAAQQVGGAINVAVITTVLVEVQNKHPFPSYKGPSSAFWFVVALGIAQAIMVLLLFKPQTVQEVTSIDAVGEEKGEVAKA